MIEFIKINEDGTETRIPVEDITNIGLPDLRLPPFNTKTGSYTWYFTNEPLQIYIGIKEVESNGVKLNYDDGSEIILPESDKLKAIAYINRAIGLLEDAKNALI